MDLIIAPYSVPMENADKAPVDTIAQYATDGNPAQGIPATILPAHVVNAIVAEIVNAIRAGGKTPDRNNWNQLADIIGSIMKKVGGDDDYFLKLKSATEQKVESEVKFVGTLSVDGHNLIINPGELKYTDGILNLPSAIWQFDGNNAMSMFATHDMNEGKKITIQSKSGDKVTNSIILREDGTINASNFSGKKIIADELRPLSEGKIDNYSEMCHKGKNIVIDAYDIPYVNDVLNMPSVIWLLDDKNSISMFATNDLKEGKKITIQSKSGDKVTNSIILREDGTINASNFSGKKIIADELRPLSEGKIDNYSEMCHKGKNIVIDAYDIPYVNDVLNMPSVIWLLDDKNSISMFATNDLKEGKKITIQSKINDVVYNAIVFHENGKIECNELQSKDISVTDGTLNINSTNRDMNENGLIVGNSSIRFNLVNRPGQTGGIYLQEDFKNNNTDLVFYSGNSFYTMDDQGTITGKNFNGVSMSAFCADLAEYYIADERYDPGTLVRIGGEKEITRASIGGFFYGVISTSPAYIMNTAIRDRKNALPVALAGRVPVLVTGMIDKGDPVTISEISGVARKAKDGERHIGFSMENSHETSIRPVECVIRQN